MDNLLIKKRLARLFKLLASIDSVIKDLDKDIADVRERWAERVNLLVTPDIKLGRRLETETNGLSYTYSAGSPDSGQRKYNTSCWEPKVGEDRIYRSGARGVRNP